MPCHLNSTLNTCNILLLDFCSPARAYKVLGRCRFCQPCENYDYEDCEDNLSYDDDDVDPYDGDGNVDDPHDDVDDDVPTPALQ